MSSVQQRKLYELCWQFEESWRSGEPCEPQQWLARATDLPPEVVLTELTETQRELESSRAQSNNATLVKDERYEFIEEIARGGAAVVWRVRDHHLHRDTAVKYLLDSRDNADMRARLEREARLCAGLVHPGIVPIHELSCFADQRPFVSMKLVEGKTWLQHLQSEPRPALQNSIEVFTKVCEAMSYAHGKGIIHRDLKPSNIMVGKFGEVQIMDWGLAKSLSEASNSLNRRGDQLEPSVDTVPSCEDTATSQRHQETTLIGTVIGTLAYMSPEQAIGAVDEVDKRSDVFSLGAILCRLLTGHPPYAAATQAELLQQAQAAELSSVRKRLAQSGHRALASLAIRCLCVDPKQRPADAAALLQLLNQIRASDNARRQWRRAVLVAISLLLAVSISVVFSRWTVEARPAPLLPEAESPPETLTLDAATLTEMIRRGEVDRALPHYRPAIERNPTDWELLYNVSLALINRERFAEAEPVTRQLIRLPPDRAEPHFLLSTALFWQGQFDQALEEVRHSQRLRDAGEQVSEPISIRIDQKLIQMERYAHYAKQIAEGDLSPFEHYTPEELLDVGRVYGISGSLIEALECFQAGLARFSKLDQHFIEKYQLLIQIGRVTLRRTDLPAPMLQQVSEQLVDWYEQLTQTALDSTHADPSLLRGLKAEPMRDVIFNICKDERLVTSLRERLKGLHEKVLSAPVP